MADITGLQGQLRQLRDFYSTQPNGEQQLYQRVSDYARQQGLSAADVAQVVQGVAPNAGAWDAGRVQRIMDNNQPGPGYGNTGMSWAQGPDQYGLAGATNALVGGTGDAINSISGGARDAIGAVRSGSYDASQTLGTGLQSAISTLQGGQSAALSGLGQTQGQVSGLFNQAQQGLAPFASQGLQANQLQAALSGALGPEAQRQAYAQYQESPGVDYARSQAERAITRNASALGGLGGGNVMQELGRNAVGTYLQDFNNQFGRIGQVADRGFSAAGAQASLRGQEGGIQAQLGQFGAQIPLQTADQIAGLQTATANNIAGMQYGTGNAVGNIHSAASNNIGGMQYGTGSNLASTRYQTGQDLANSVSSTSSALSSLINQQGAGLTDITGNTTNNLSALYQQASAGDANAMEQLAALLGNISTQNASMVGGQPIIQGQPTNYLGQLGQVAGGVGGLAQGLSYGQQPATQSVYQNPTSGLMPTSNPNPMYNYYA